MPENEVLYAPMRIASHCLEIKKAREAGESENVIFDLTIGNIIKEFNKFIKTINDNDLSFDVLISTAFFRPHELNRYPAQIRGVPYFLILEGVTSTCDAANREGLILKFLSQIFDDWKYQIDADISSIENRVQDYLRCSARKLEADPQIKLRKPRRTKHQPDRTISRQLNRSLLKKHKKKPKGDKKQ